MVSNLIEEDELMNQLIEESPYLNRAYRRGLAEREAQQKAEKELIRREFIMDAIATRFSPSLEVYRDFESKIRFLHDENLLKEVFEQAITTESLEVFQRWLLEQLKATSKDPEEK